MRVQNPGSTISFFRDCKLNSGSIELTKTRVSGSYFGSISAIKKNSFRRKMEGMSIPYFHFLKRLYLRKNTAKQ